MSQASQTKPGQGRPGQGRPGQGRPVQYGGGRPGEKQTRRPRREPVEEVWIPKTILGQKVNSGEISSIEEIIEAGLRIQRQVLSKNYFQI